MSSKESAPAPSISAYQAFKAGFFAMLGVIVANLILGVGAFLVFVVLGVGIPVGLSILQRDKLTSQATEARPASAVISARVPSSTAQPLRSDRR